MTTSEFSRKIDEICSLSEKYSTVSFLTIPTFFNLLGSHWSRDWKLNATWSDIARRTDEQQRTEGAASDIRKMTRDICHVTVMWHICCRVLYCRGNSLLPDTTQPYLNKYSVLVNFVQQINEIMYYRISFHQSSWCDNLKPRNKYRYAVHTIVARSKGWLPSDTRLIYYPGIFYYPILTG